MPRKSIIGAVGRFIRKHREKRYIYRKLLTDEYCFSLATTRLFSSRGIIENCDIHAEVPVSSSVADDYVRSIPRISEQIAVDRRPVSIYLCTDSVPLFVSEVLDQFHRPFVLVSGDSDLSVSGTTIKNIAALLSSPYLQRWFAQNLEYDHPKIQSMPIGFDFHSAWQDPRLYSGRHILPAHQEGVLRKICRTAKKFSERLPLVVCDWIGHSKYGDREEARRHISEKARFVPTKRLPRHELWQEYAKHAFVASPFGVGLDCHRTWEAIALGCVPIVKRSPISGLFEDMPVLIIDDWAQITVDYLIEQHKKIANQTFNYSKLFLSYWAKRIEIDECAAELRSSVDDMWLWV